MKIWNYFNWLVSNCNMENPLSNLQIKSPCSQNWAAMSGTEKVKFCASCQKSVFDLSEISRKKVVKLIENKQYNLCVRIYRDEKGEIITNESSVLKSFLVRNTKRLVSGILSVFLAVSMFAINLNAGQIKSEKHKRVKAKLAKIKKKIRRKYLRVHPTMGVYTEDIGEVPPPLVIRPKRESDADSNRKIVVEEPDNSDTELPPPILKKP